MQEPHLLRGVLLRPEPALHPVRVRTRSAGAEEEDQGRDAAAAASIPTAALVGLHPGAQVPKGAAAATAAATTTAATATVAAEAARERGTR